MTVKLPKWPSNSMFFHIIPKNIPKNAQKLHTDSNADREVYPGHLDFPISPAIEKPTYFRIIFP
jgi:hypothetical protein